MKPFHTLFPDIAEKETRVLKVHPNNDEEDSPPPGLYFFMEIYCERKNCDCRRVMISVHSQAENRSMAAINMGFDPQGPEPGPFLDPWNPQSEYADLFIQAFVDIINREPDYLEQLQDHYIMFKEAVEKTPYQGKRFKKPGKKRSVLEPGPLPDRQAKDVNVFLKNLIDELGEALENDYLDDDLFDEDMLDDDLFDEYLFDDEPPPPSIPPKKAGKKSKSGKKKKTKSSKQQSGASKLIRGTAARLKNEPGENPVDVKTKNHIASNPDIVFSLLSELLDKYSPTGGLEPELSPEYEAGVILMEEALTEIRYSVERNRAWAEKTSEKIQKKIAERAFQVNVDTRVQSDLLQALYRAGLEIHPDIKEKSEELATYYSRFTSKGGSSGLERMFDAIIADGFQTPFELLDFVMAEMTILPPEGQLSIIAEMAASKHSIIRDFAGLMLLHPDPEVRSHVPMIFNEFTDESTVSPETFRRMIGLRNWLPEDERPGLDALIKRIRSARVECAPMPNSTFGEASVSTFDGSGIQGAWVFTSEKRKFTLSGIMVRQTEGVREAWVRKGLNKSEMNAIYGDISQSILTVKTDPEYFHRLTAHFLWTGVQNDTPPPPELLEVAESIGKTYWHPEPLDYDAELKRMESEADPKTLKPAYVSKVLSESKHWPDEETFASSWFEDDAGLDHIIDIDDIDDIVEAGKSPRNDFNTQITEFFENKRELWFERLLWMALWAKSCIGRPPFKWEKFLILAREFHRGAPVEDIPLMMSVIERSIYFSIHRQR